MTSPTEPPDSPTAPTTAGTIAEAIARELRSNRSLDGELTRGALVLEITLEDGGSEAWTIAVDGKSVWVSAGAGGLPAAPTASLATSEENLLHLVRGTESALALLGDGRLRLGGAKSVLKAFAACLQPGESWLSVRLGR